MRRHDTYPDTQPQTFTPCLATLIETQARLSAQRVPRGSGIIERLALGMGIVLLLAMLGAWGLASVSGPGSDTPAATAPQSQTRSPAELEELGLAPVLFDDFFVRF